VLRGFALLGILAMNIRAMAAPFGAYMYPYALFDYVGASREAYVFTSVVFDLKMMGLFSMLFGAGVLLYAGKSQAGGGSPRGLWFRRMFWLLVIGLVHSYLIWNGDILVPYALCGLLLLWWVRRLRPAYLLAAAIVVLSVGGLLSLGHGTAWESMSEEERAQETAIMTPSREQALAQVGRMQGPYLDVVRSRAAFVFMGQTMYFAMFFFWRCGGMMLLGMSLYKYGFLDGSRPDRVYITTAAICIPIGLALAWFGVVELERVGFLMPGRAAADLWNYVGSALASVGYAALVILLVNRGLLGVLRTPLAAVGQMALSNYLLHSLLSSVVFLGWGLGLVGRWDYAEQLAYVAGVWAVQLAISPIWLRHFRFGPAEWAWRSLSYWHRQPMRRDSPQGSALARA
jgi:uncharacterized protein